MSFMSSFIIRTVAMFLYISLLLDGTAAYLMWSSGYMNGAYPNRVVEVIYHTMELPWDGARTVCRENGGDLAKLEDLTFSELIKRYEEESDIDENIFLYKDYWVGLRGDGNDNFFWVFDCTLLQNSIDFNLTSIGNNNNCFLRHAGSLRTGKRVQCSVKKPFVCQRYTDEMCKVDDVFMADISNILTTITYDECMDYCIYDTSCTDIIFIANSSCYLLQTSPLYSGEMQIASKSCIRVSINETMITTIAETTENFCNVTLAIQSSSPTSYITQSTAVSSELQISSTVSSLLETSNWLQSSQCVTITETEVISLPCESTLPSTSPTPSITQSTSFASLTPSSFGTPFSASETILISSAETDDLEVIAQAIILNLTIDTKKTSAYTRKLSSADDSRTTSAVMGCVGLVCVILPVALIALSDLKLIYLQFRTKAIAPFNKETSFKMRRIKVN